MPRKLTLSVDEGLIAFAHAYAKYNETSISALFEQYLERLRGEAKPGEPDLHPKARALYGILKDVPDKKELLQDLP